MKRRKSREYVLQMLFQHEFTGRKTDFEFFETIKPDEKNAEEVKKFSDELFRGTLQNLTEIDRIIQQAAEHWKIERMAAVDRNILRFAVYEIMFRKDIPSAVTINEALEIAKKYSSIESASFINGLLDKIAEDTLKTA